MRVNSALKGFFNYRSVYRRCTGVVALVVFLIASAFTNPSDRELRSKQTNLLIRLIGHQLLLQAGDSTSRVLPVTEINEGTFLLGFENRYLFFSHDSLVTLTQRLLPKSRFPSGYTVTVHECLTSRIAYGFQINNSSPDILACQGRTEPEGCYSIEIAFRDLYENVKQKTTDTDKQREKRKSVQVEEDESDVQPEQSKSIEHERLKQSLAASEASLQQANASPDEWKTASADYRLIKLASSGMMVLLGVTLLVGRFGKISTPLSVHSHDVSTRTDPTLHALGRFLFDVKRQRLLLGSEIISLTDKECRILELLNQGFGELISRETLMEKIWINEGVITGRSLDMFVSKLRKKLSGDPDLRITNVHGKGYKLEAAHNTDM